MEKDNLVRWATGFSSLLLIGSGLLVVAFASQAVAWRIGLDELHFAYRHAAFALLGVVSIVVLSQLNVRVIVVLAMAVYALAIVLMFVAAFFGTPAKGAARWIHVAGFSIQPSEFAKPALAVIVCAIFAQSSGSKVVASLKAFAITAVAMVGLVLQPDFGMAFLMLLTFGFAGFAAGWSMGLVSLGGVAVGAFGALSYFLLPHVRSRVDRFLDPQSGDTYQLSRSLDAIANGGIPGVGLGEGRFRDYVPDVHADFIFAALVEEVGLAGGIVVLAAIATIVIGNLFIALRARNSFVMLALATLAVQFGIQAFINLGSTTGVLPTKGMTLPLVSYGGSALLSACMAIGFMLALSRSSVLEQRRLGDTA